MSATSGEEMGEGQQRGRRVSATDQQASDKLPRYMHNVANIENIL